MRHTKHILITIAIFSSVSGDLLGQSTASRKRYAAAKEVYDQVKGAWITKMRAASAAERVPLLKQEPRADEHAAEFWSIVEDDPESEGAYLSLIWIHREVPQEAQWRKARALLVADHASRKDLLPLIESMSAYPDDEAGAWVLSTFRGSADHVTRGYACYRYALWLSTFRRDQADKAELAVEFFDQLFVDYSDVNHPELGLLATSDRVRGYYRKAKAYARMAIGREAPEIEGLDLDGVSFKVSDYLGKVVLLSYWAYT